MTNISKRKLKTPDYQLAYQELASLITRLNNTNAHFLLEELLTDSERIMLIKRFAAIFMFSRDHSPYRVSQTLAISESTAGRIFRQYHNDDFGHLLRAIPKKTKSQFASLIEDLIMAQVSPRARARLMNRVL